MELETEFTFLAKWLPPDLKDHPSIEIIDLYIPASAPTMRIRKRGEKMELTKKIQGKDAAEQQEYTIPLSQAEYNQFTQLPAQKVKKIRYFYPVDERTAEIDLFQDELEGLVFVEFEFKTANERDTFTPPDFCLADLTYEPNISGRYLAGKTLQDIQSILDKYNYKKL